MMKSNPDIPYNRLLSSQDDDEREFLNLEELKPHQLTELGILNLPDDRNPLSVDSQAASGASVPAIVPVSIHNAQENPIFRAQTIYHLDHQSQSLLHQVPLHHHHAHHHQPLVHRLAHSVNGESEPIYYDLSSHSLSE